MKKIKAMFRARFKEQKAAVIKRLHANTHKLAKIDNKEFQDLWDELSAEGRKDLMDALSDELRDMALDGVANGFEQLQVAGADLPEIERMLSQANEKAIDWAVDRAAELVGMKNVGTKEAPDWIENPNSEWTIDETTREDINALVSQGLEEGWSNDELASAIGEANGFSDYRAEMIARTETAFADVQGNYIAYQESGMVEKVEWVLGEEACEDCQENADAGPIDLGDTFPSGDDMPPAHPNCRCDLLPLITPSEED